MSLPAASAIDKLGVHDSVGAVFPPEVLASDLADLPLEVDVIGDADIDDCDAVVTLEDREAYLECHWVHSIQAGVDRFPFDEFEAADVVLTNSAGIHGRPIGESVAGYLLAFARRLHHHVAHQQDQRWVRPAWDEAFTLPGTTACVVGTGTLGQGVADVLGPLGLEVIGVRRSGDPLPGFDEMYASGGLLEAVADADFVIATVPLTDETHHLFDEAAFDAMRDDAYVVNVARGPVVDEAALVAALESDSLAGAAIDVFEEEPLPAESPLWELEDVIVTPHAAGFTRDYYRGVAGIVRENVERLESGESFVNRVV